MYDSRWHAAHGDRTSASAREVVARLRDAFDPGSVLDVGCGDGRWLSCFGEAGVADLRGLDGPWNDVDALLIDRDRYAVQELGEPFDLGRRFDLAVSLEVAEHVDPSAADAFVASLVRHADVVVFSAAIPYQGGFRHVNERWQSWWAERFAAHGYRAFDPFRAALWEREDVHVWYRQNLLVYVSEAAPARLEQMRRHLDAHGVRELPLDVVHPSKYADIASYEQIAFKPLLRRLPLGAADKVRQVVRERVAPRLFGRSS